MILWAVVGLALLALAVAGAVWLMRTGGSIGLNQRPVTPEDVLRRRYAAGEVDEDEYLRRMAGLTR